MPVSVWWSVSGKSRQFYIRQLSDAKIKPVVEIMKPSHLISYAHLCGRSLARAHARSGDVVILVSYMGQSNAFEDAMASFSEAYADQNEKDHVALLAAVRAGHIQAQVEY
jgi:ABC-type sugar transport system substrate-binding protein